MFFANAERIGEKIRPLIAEAKPKVVALDLEGVFDLEYTALKMLTEAEKTEREQGVLCGWSASRPECWRWSSIRPSVRPWAGTGCSSISSRPSRSIRHRRCGTRSSLSRPRRRACRARAGPRTIPSGVSWRGLADSAPGPAGIGRMDRHTCLLAALAGLVIRGLTSSGRRGWPSGRAGRAAIRAESRKKESLYRDFVDEASRLYVAPSSRQHRPLKPRETIRHHHPDACRVLAEGRRWRRQSCATHPGHVSRPKQDFWRGRAHSREPHDRSPDSLQ